MAHDQRAARLNKFFYKTLSGEQHISTSQHAQHFLEAIRLHNTPQKTPSACIERILSTAAGSTALHAALRVDLTTTFLLNQTLPTFTYLSDPRIKSLVDGQLLQKILHIVAEPPTVWNALAQCFRQGQIPDNLLTPFAWLSLELISLPPKANLNASIIKDIQTFADKGEFLKTQHHPTRELGYKIKRIAQVLCSPKQQRQSANGPGGRHDNDHEDFRNIRIYPTTDEFLSTQPPYCLTAKEVFETKIEDRARVHLDNQFRLEREDMVAGLRDDHQVAIGIKKGRRSGLVLGGLVPVGVSFGDEDNERFRKCAMLLQCRDGLQFLERKDMEAKKRFLLDDKSFLKHQAFGVLCRGKEVFGFAFVDRDVELLLKSPPIVSLQFTDPHGFGSALMALMVPHPTPTHFIFVDTAVFAYEPVLVGLQSLTDISLQDILVNPGSASPVNHTGVSGLRLDHLRLLQNMGGIEGSIELPKLANSEQTITVDESQLTALIDALTNPVSLIQGPPGTGKSFVGAQIANFFFNSGLRILVISYTNHALDQFLEDLMKAGIPQDEIVRIGAKAKCTAATLPLLLGNQKGSYRRSRDAWSIVNALKADAVSSLAGVQRAFGQFIQSSTIKWDDISDYLEFSDDDVRFYTALEVPERNDNWHQAGRNGRAVGPDYLYQEWISGRGAGFFAKKFSPASKEVWAMSLAERLNHHQRWTSALIKERLEVLQSQIQEYNNSVEEIDIQFSEGDAALVRSKMVLGCTTTAAAKHDRLMRAFQPDVVLVEEAGEILESHVLTSLTSTVKHLVLIGDHKQLRPKINNYSLSVEKGDGFDLNRSMFERLILQGAKHQTLQKQHRMVPEISMFPRELTYPDLVDAPKTFGRDPIRGLRDRVIFFNHGKMEESDKALRERRDPGAKESKRNTWEAKMVLRCVKYLGQQGYGAHQIVILTPYLGQLRVIRDLLQNGEHAAELSEMDKADLIRAGLLSHAAAQVNKTPLRISTIDNYQGEESDIVIASLTRSNDSGDVGFMSAPERLNVLITRARNCLILIGNMATFMSSKKGTSTWHPFFKLLKDHNHLYDGLPVKCEKHPETQSLLQELGDFDKACPDGGCTKPCNARLKCAIHKCKLRCHRITDHSKTECHERVQKTCERKHVTRVSCSRLSDKCHDCIKEDIDTERRVQRDLKLEAERQRRQAEYKRQLQELDDELDHERRLAKYRNDEENQKKTLEQRRADLISLKESAKRVEEIKKRQEQQAAAAAPNPAPTPSPSVDTFNPPTGAKAEWEEMKRSDGSQSPPMDELMNMIGLEEVKQEFLSVKSKVDLAVRQGTSLATDRFSCSMLGNPGTGKTTVARLYGRFLTEVGVIPGNQFVETTGAAIASNGVKECKTMVDGVLSAGGGVIFIDEAYQLTSGNNPGGPAVLDYLLAEVENLRGKVVFVLAGYDKQMESFFAHNPGLPSRFPIQMKFEDYTDDELLRILELKIRSKYKGAMKCEGGLRGLYCRIVARRVGYCRGKEGFGNARAVENTLSLITKRQSNRIRRTKKSKPDDFLLTKEDLIGPEPQNALSKCQAWKDLNQLIGLGSVKEAIKALVDSIQQNYQRELAEQPPIQYSLNKVFLGNPGTGKTTVAKLYGRILVALGLLSRGEVLIRNPSDFVGAFIGHSEKNTKGILASAMGKVLVIDEAYGLYGGANAGGSGTDSFKTGVIDTIVAEVQSVPGEDRAVLLLGYKPQMEDMFQNVNPGLARRFPIASGFDFQDFSQPELRQILDLKLKQQGYQATKDAARVAMEILDRARNRPNFGNAGEVDILLDATKSRHMRRISKESTGQTSTPSNTLLEPQDFDENFNRAERSETNVRMLFKDTVGTENIVSLLEGYQGIVKKLRAIKMDPKESIPFNFLFRGPPGTGKTTTARRMGKVFYDMGFLATAEVVECSTSDLIAQYVGQTGPKVLNQLDKALGRVLFIDEAYRLGEGRFAQEAMDELVDSVTKERYHKKMIIILAGYDADINRLMSVNTGLTSRFPAVIDFRALTPGECVSLLVQLLRKQQEKLRSKGNDLDLSCLETPTVQFSQQLLEHFGQLQTQDGWASARDVGTLATNIFNRVLRSDKDAANLLVDEPGVREEFTLMLKERKARSKYSTTRNPTSAEIHAPMKAPPTTMPPKATGTTSTTTVTAQAQSQRPVSPLPPPSDDSQVSAAKDTPIKSNNSLRDAGVSDEVWEQLQRDQKAQQEREKEYQRLKEEAEKASEAAREEIVKRLLEEERKRKEELERQKKLTASGRCPMGYTWIKQSGGYRCAGGSHWMSDGDVAKM